MTRKLVGVVAGEPSGTINPKTPLAHKVATAFPVLLTVLRSEEPLDEETIRRRIPYFWPSSVTRNLDSFVRDGVFVGGEGRRFRPAALPKSLKPFVLRLADLIDDPRLAPSEASGARTESFEQNADGAPRLFGTDVRLRNLMALAVHDPMLHSDLRRITGTWHLRLESRDAAPFGRGSVVRVWDTSDGEAVMLDTAYPLYLPLQRLLVKLAEIYPLPAHVPEFGRPDPPPPQAWNGDRLALFGSPLPTAVLMSLCDRGWTFEAICCEVATGYDRVVVKKTTRRLEQEGVLEGSRPRGPGFGPRLLSLAKTCPARDELQALIDAAIEVWPDIGDRVRLAFKGLPDKTKVYFRKRGLWSDR